MYDEYEDVSEAFLSPWQEFTQSPSLFSTQWSFHEWLVHFSITLYFFLQIISDRSGPEATLATVLYSSAAKTSYL